MNNQNYLRAIRQIDALIALFRRNAAVSCALAEQQDARLIRLSSLKDSLRPDDEKAIADINRYYRRHIHEYD